MRADFLERLAEDRAFMSQITRGLLFLAPMRRDALRDAIVRPLELAGYVLEDQHRFVATMLDALADTRSPLPLLQFTAAKLWELRDPETRQINRASYEQLGGIAGALASHADMVLAASSAREQALMHDVFLSLVTEERTRAIVSLDDLRRARPRRRDRSCHRAPRRRAPAADGHEHQPRRVDRRDLARVADRSLASAAPVAQRR